MSQVKEDAPQEGGTFVRMPGGRLIKVPEGTSDPLAAAQAVLDAETAEAAKATAPAVPGKKKQPATEE